MSSLKKLSIVAAAVFLTACGGGGSDSGSSDPVPPTTNPPVVDNNYPTTIIPANYVDTQRSDIMNTLNTYRTQCGYGALKQNSLLDVATQGHANYTQMNRIATHDQVASNPGFTGANISDRLLASGYHRSKAGEIMATLSGGTSFSGATGVIPYSPDPIPGKVLLKSLLSTVYHLAGAMGEWNDIGVGYSISNNLSADPKLTNFYSSAVVNFGVPYGSQAPEYKGTEIRSFPCDNVTSVSPIFVAENPSPYPIRDFNMNPMGTPIIFTSPNEQMLTILESEYTNLTVGSTVTAKIFNSSDDPHKSIKPWAAFVIPDQPLKENTKYQVKVKLAINGNMTNKTVTFATGTIY